MANPGQSRNDPKGGGGGSSVGGMVEGAKDLARQAGGQAEHAATTAGRAAQSVADTIRSHAPSSGMLGSAAEAVSSTVERGGKYLEEKQFSGVADDLTNAIRNNPVPALLIGVGVGFLLARALSRD